MYLSCLMLNPRSKRTQRELVNPYEMHRSLYAAFPKTLPAGERILYRVDEHPRSGTPMLLVQSQSKPDWTRADESPGYLLTQAACKPLNLNFILGEIYAFRLRANPTVKKATHKPDGMSQPGYVAIARARYALGEKDPERNGVRLGLVHEEEQRGWLTRQGERSGFRLHQVVVLPEGMQIAIRPDGYRLSHLAVRYEGVLEIADEDAFMSALAQGIGAAKGFGFGLLSLAPATA